jgi:hypothetical protein
MSNFSAQVVRSIGRHFVSITCVQTPPDGGAKALLFSGFIADIVGEWFYITAGHILRDIESAIDAGSKFNHWRLGDQTAGKQSNNIAVPYDFELKHWCTLEESSTGLDYAALHIGGLYRMQLEAGGVVPIAKQGWGDYVSSHNHWVLAGIPSESISYDDKTNFTAKFVMIPLVSETPTMSAGQKAVNRFSARILEGSDEVVKDIDGMSGGPIIMLSKASGAWKYSVIGIQSAWCPSTRTILACPFSSFAKALEPVVLEALSQCGRQSD